MEKRVDTGGPWWNARSRKLWHIVVLLCAFCDTNGAQHSRSAAGWDKAYLANILVFKMLHLSQFLKKRWDSWDSGTGGTSGTRDKSSGRWSVVGGQKWKGQESVGSQSQ
jgi:hypothetical protein